MQHLEGIETKVPVGPAVLEALPIPEVVVELGGIFGVLMNDFGVGGGGVCYGISVAECGFMNIM